MIIVYRTLCKGHLSALYVQGMCQGGQVNLRFVPTCFINLCIFTCQLRSEMLHLILLRVVVLLNTFYSFSVTFSMKINYFYSLTHTAERAQTNFPLPSIQLSFVALHSNQPPLNLECARIQTFTVHVEVAQSSWRDFIDHLSDSLKTKVPYEEPTWKELFTVPEHQQHNLN